MSAWFPASVIGLLIAVGVWVSVAEHYEQQANRHACPGRYIRVGDRRDSGLCIRRDAVIWER